MADETLARLDEGEVVVELLDHSGSRPVKTWRFAGLRRISIGRDATQDVEISDPFVSRTHAELAWGGGEWTLVSRGRHGVLVENQMVTECPVRGEVTFRLGVAGPTLRFASSAPIDPGSQTLSFDKIPEDLLAVDERKLERDLREITDGDYFQQLKEKTRRLRDRREKP
jgi:pSer/pThr/pTyr-binding forkhead associated (FHA) protein